jgi:UDP-glucuronate decarboxylase
MKILVTGAAGFLGSHLVDKLLALGHEVVGIDNFYTGSVSNVEKHKLNSKFELIEQDVRTPLTQKVDGIFNLACPASPVHYQKTPVETIMTSFLGAANVLDLAKKLNCRVFQASTSEIYGDPESSPQREEYWGNVNPVGIRSCYDEGKRAAETLFFDYHRQFNVDIAVARIFNTYGPRMQFNDGRVVSNFIIQALNGEPLTVYGDGLQTRSLCFVSDLIDAICGVFFSDSKPTGPINIGNPEEIAMVSLAEKIIQLTGSNSKIIYLDLPSDDPKQRKPDISRVRKEINWEPKVTLRDGLTQTIADFTQRKSLGH